MWVKQLANDNYTFTLFMMQKYGLKYTLKWGFISLLWLSNV